MSEDTNTNEKKFHVDEFAVNIGRHVNSSIDKGNNVKVIIASSPSPGAWALIQLMSFYVRHR